MSEFEFVESLPDLPKGAKNNPLVARFAVALKARPGQWAKYPISPLTANNASGIAARINKTASDAPVPFRGGGFEARAIREDGDRENQRTLYVRYVGGVSA